MTIVYFYQYFATPKGSWGTRVYEFAKVWVEQGHKVIVVTSVYSKSDLRAEKFIESQNIDGIDLKVINILIDNKQSFVKRIFSFIAYSFISCYYSLTLKYDIAIASSGPITTALPGLCAKLLRRKKMVFEVRDLWPQGAIEMGILKSPLIKRLSFALEALSYKKADHIIVLSPGMKDNIHQRFSIGEKITSVTNSANIELFCPKEDRFHQKNIFHAIYTGNIGEINNSLWLLEAAKLLQHSDYTDIKIILVGDGQQKQYILNEINKSKLDTIEVKDLMPKHQLVPLIQESMVSLVPLKGKPILDTSSPNKFFESLAAGVPVIQNTEGWMKAFLEENQVGFTISPNDPKGLAMKLIEIRNWSNEERNDVKKRCLNTSKQFDKNVLAKKMLNAIVNT
jgi:glycosyltransferase involved in cell wall biosynthesis